MGLCPHSCRMELEVLFLIILVTNELCRVLFFIKQRMNQRLLSAYTGTVRAITSLCKLEIFSLTILTSFCISEVFCFNSCLYTRLLSKT